MAVKFPQADLPRGVRGGADVWDQIQAGPVLADDYFPAATGPQTVTQGTRFDNANTFYGGTVTQPGGGTQTVTQGTRFDNTNAFYGGTVSQTTPAQSVTQSARFDNLNTFYGGTVTQSGGPQTVTQVARFDTLNEFFGGVVTGGSVPVSTGPSGVRRLNTYVRQQLIEFYTRAWAKPTKAPKPDPIPALETKQPAPAQPTVQPPLVKLPSDAPRVAPLPVLTLQPARTETVARIEGLELVSRQTDQALFAAKDAELRLRAQEDEEDEDLAILLLS